MSDDDLVRPSFNFPINEKNVPELPDKVLCVGCGQPLAVLSKDSKTHRISIRVCFTTPPKVLNLAERLGLATCDGCGAKTQIDLLLFGKD